MAEEDNLRQWEEQRQYAIKNQDAIRQQYGTDYIAVKDCQVIDHDKDEFVLAKRIEEKFRDQIVLISTLENILNPKANFLESPEVETME